MGEDETGIRTCPGEHWGLKDVTARSGPVIKAEKIVAVGVIVHRISDVP